MSAPIVTLNHGKISGKINEVEFIFEQKFYVFFYIFCICRLPPILQIVCFRMKIFLLQRRLASKNLKTTAGGKEFGMGQKLLEGMLHFFPQI